MTWNPERNRNALHRAVGIDDKHIVLDAINCGRAKRRAAGSGQQDCEKQNFFHDILRDKLDAASVANDHVRLIDFLRLLKKPASFVPELFIPSVSNLRVR